MSWLAVAFIAAGLADLSRAAELGLPRMAPHAVNVVTTIVLAALTGLLAPVDIAALMVLAAVVSAWVETSRRTLEKGQHPLVPLLVLFGGAALALAFSGFAGHAAGPLASWLSWAQLPTFVPDDAARVLLVVALVLANMSTANIIVRCVLVAMGAMRPERHRSATAQPEPADALRGGRLLGPLERLLILGLGLAGEFGAAGLVVAAKGLLRFPEIQATTKEATAAGAGVAKGVRAASDPQAGRVGNGIEDVTEYFLIGSFVSWIVALASLALAR